MVVADSISVEGRLTLELSDELTEYYQIVFDLVKNDKIFDLHVV